MTTRFAILAAVGATTLAGPALAGTAINYADLNLETAQGQAQLDRRIDGAARAICGIADVRTGTLLQGTKNIQCYDAAKASARKQVAERVARGRAQGG
ncbi:MAG: UrcA family protein [Croceibacterium sp.]